MDELIFLGTGGGRHTTLFQARATGGVIYKTSGHQLHIDPGPGALLRCKECKVYPFKTDILIATHPHIDHVNDLNILIEGVTQAATKKMGTLIAPKKVIEQSITVYHKNLLKEVIEIEPEQTIRINSLIIKAVRCEHTPLTGVGFKFYTNNYCFYYTSDTSIYSGFEKKLEDVDVLLANTILPGDKKWEGHMATNDLISVIKNSKHKLKLVILNHFGTLMLRAGPELEAQRVMIETGVKTIAAADSLIIRLKVTGRISKSLLRRQ